MNKPYLFLLFLLVGCDPTVTVTFECVEYTRESMREQADWTLTCINNGNPKSDEEGEDLVIQCERSSQALLPPVCARSDFVVEEFGNGYRDKKNCAVISGSHLIDACKAAGWKKP
jgi:hypothetical protein